MNNLGPKLDEWFDAQRGAAATMLLVDTNGRKTCILRSGIQTVGQVGNGATCEDAIMVALRLRPHTIPGGPLKNMSRPVVDITTRDDFLLPGIEE